jgi:hypothetical protein
MERINIQDTVGKTISGVVHGIGGDSILFFFTDNTFSHLSIHKAEYEDDFTTITNSGVEDGCYMDADLIKHNFATQIELDTIRAEEKREREESHRDRIKSEYQRLFGEKS